MLGNEARNLLADAFESGARASELASVFKVSERTVRRVAKQKRDTGSADLRTSSRGRKRSLSEGDLARIDAFVEGRPDATVDEVIEALSLPVCNETCRKAIASLGWVRKKRSVHAAERERLRRGREA